MALSLAAANTTTLSNGRTMPVVGFGCAGQLSRGPIGLALEQGYRLFDTSQATEWYLEAELGEALRASSVPRSELFITTKLHPRDLGESSTLEAFPAREKTRPRRTPARQPMKGAQLRPGPRSLLVFLLDLVLLVSLCMRSGIELYAI